MKTILLMCLAVLGMTLGASAATAQINLRLGEDVAVDVRSGPVRWKNNDYHLVRLGSARFDLAEPSRLKAELQAGVTSFDEVDYEISCAVFDGDGNLLGVARAPCHVERMWLGRLLNSERKLILDFG